MKRTFILGEKETTLKVLNDIIPDKENILFKTNYDFAEVKMKNGDIIKCLPADDRVRGGVPNIVYVPHNIELGNFLLCKMFLSHGQEMEIIMYKFNENEECEYVKLKNFKEI